MQVALGSLHEGDAVGVTQYGPEEMTALVSEAARHERKVMAHAKRRRLTAR